MTQINIRNIAIIAHVDHGKTTLVDAMFHQSGMFHEKQEVKELLMDSMDLERERGITISSKNGSFKYRGYTINIIDTPGHADFGGQVERVLKMADGAILVVDAQEGPMPQTYFVLKKALAMCIPIIVLINKMDKPAARPDWVVNQVFDLFVKLEAPDDVLDFPILYGSSKDGWASEETDSEEKTLEPLFRSIVKEIPAPSGNPEAPLQMLISSIDYSPYLGRLGIGKITNGTLNTKKDIVVARRDGTLVPARISKVYRFESNQKVAIDVAGTGEIVAVAGMDEVTVGVTYTDPLNPTPLPPTKIDPPTLSMNFIPNNSPFAGTEGRFVTSTHLSDRLKREVLVDVALSVDELPDSPGYKVSGRGELHLSILIESMRREGYEFQVTRPQVIMKHEGEVLMEPYEELTIDVEEEYMGAVIEKLGSRKGQMINLTQENGMAKMVFKIPTRGILGYQAEFMSDTRGMGIMNYLFDGYKPFAGDIKNRKAGVLVVIDNCTTLAFPLFSLQDRGELFYGAGERVYRGQILGEHCRDQDLMVNPARGKKLTNMRSSGTDANVILTPPNNMSLEAKISYINDDELVEVTPKAIRMRKREVMKF